MGRNNNPTRGSTIRHVVRTIAAASAAAATLVAGMLVAGTANAASMRDPFERTIQNGNPGLWTNLGTITFSNGNKYENMEQSLGVVDRVNGRNTYCIQADVLYTDTPEGPWSEWTDENSRPDAQRLAWLTDKYNGNKDDLTQAAIAGLIHRELDPIGPEYLQNVQRLGWKDGTSWATYEAKMNELWNEAVANTPAGLKMEYQYTQSKRKG
ncbi:cell surface protein, partial [Bifidobacterium longum]